jgi:hypothetical protein
LFKIYVFLPFVSFFVRIYFTMISFTIPVACTMRTEIDAKENDVCEKSVVTIELRVNNRKFVTKIYDFTPEMPCGCRAVDSKLMVDRIVDGKLKSYDAEEYLLFPLHRRLEMLAEYKVSDLQCSIRFRELKEHKKYGWKMGDTFVHRDGSVTTFKNDRGGYESLLPSGQLVEHVGISSLDKEVIKDEVVHINM